ncbi:MAG: hypothetical protein AAFX65_11660 [Cyanobacteria bacterium J06638_7]
MTAPTPDQTVLVLAQLLQEAAASDPARGCDDLAAYLDGWRCSHDPAVVIKPTVAATGKSARDLAAITPTA